MDNLKISLVCTVFNEEKTITQFLESVDTQSRFPDEIIIVDGGSTDNTVKKISEFIFKISKNTPTIKLIFKDGNRSVGRNAGIKNAKGNIMVSSDSGCILDKNWIREIIKPFSDKKIDVVAGYYKGVSKNIFQKCLIPYVLVMEDKIDEKEFLPATRSMAFKKTVWEKVGGFDKKLSHNEDYSFANKLKAAGVKMVFAKKAIVNWIPRNNLKQAFVMFFRFALGDIQAKLYREKVVYIFLRYIVALYLILLSGVERSKYLYGFDFLCLILYAVWSITKNYGYVRSFKAFFYLPLLQFTSDVAVLSGTALGLIQSFSIKSFYRLVLNNKLVTASILVYVILMLSVISYGIPGIAHPFDYFMDEWHQSQSVRDLFKLGTPNVSGAANGSIFQFFLTGLYLMPFYVSHIINFFAIKSSVTNLSLQTTLFEVFRINTLLFGVLSALVVAYIAKIYFKVNQFLTIFLFLFNPLWITLSNYFKYDIALEFWMLLAFLFMLRYADRQKVLDFILAGVFSSLALATKLEPFNLIIVYIAVFLMFTSKIRGKIKYLFAGLFIYGFVFLVFGIPDIILGKGNLREYIFSNLVSTPNAVSNNLNLGMNYWQYFIEKLYPATFGRVFYFGFLILAVVGMVWGLKRLISNKRNLRTHLFENKYLTVLLLSLVSYVLILIALRTGALANRLIPLLPMMALAMALITEKIYQAIKVKNLKIAFLVFVGILLAIQFTETISWNTLKINNPRTISSAWIVKNIKQGAVIGIENIPIYQNLPDVVLKEFYLKVYGKDISNKYRYAVINSRDKNFPKVVILSDEFIESNYLLRSDKKIILEKLKTQNYKVIKNFALTSPLFYFFNSRQEYYMSFLIQAPDAITIYGK